MIIRARHAASKREQPTPRFTLLHPSQDDLHYVGALTSGAVATQRRDALDLVIDDCDRLRPPHLVRLTVKGPTDLILVIQHSN